MKKIILFFSLSLSLFATTYSFSVGEVTKIYPQIDDEFHTVLRIEGFSSSSGVVMEPRKYYGKYYGYNDKEWILYGITSSGEKGQVVVSKSIVDTTSKHCPDDLVYDDNGLCVAPSCTPLSSQTVNIPADSCSGPITDLDSGYSGTLSYQECDSTCYVLESQNLTCKDFYANPDSLKIIAASRKSCDRDLNDWEFTCIDGSPYTLSSSCTPKNGKPIKSPCDDIRKAKITECNLNAMDIKGRCIDNGLVVTKNTLECIPKTPDCSSKWHEVLNTTTNTCECAEGFVRNSFGDCWKPLFPDDTNLTNEQQAQQNKAEQDNHAQKTLDETQENQIESQNDTNEKLDNLGNSLAGIRNDLNTTNNLLNKISDKNYTTDMTKTNDLLSQINSKLDFNDSSSGLSYVPDSGMSDNQNAIDSGLTQIYGVMGDIKGDYENLISSLENGLPSPSFSSGSDPVFCAVVFEKNICFNLCDSFSYFRDVLYYIFTITFLLTALRIYWSAFKYR